MHYNVEEIMKIIEEKGEATYSFINHAQDDKKQKSIFNVIFFDANIKNEFGKSELCVSYVDGDAIHYPTPISDIIEIF